MSTLTPFLVTVLLGSASAQQQWQNPCLTAASGLPFCDESLSWRDRAKDLVARIPYGDKKGMLMNGATASPTANISAYQWWSEALHGVGYSPGVSFHGNLPAATSFPQVCTTAHSFNRTLFNMLGSAISTEGRAFWNNRQAGLTFWTPNINIYRDPRWGRGQETPGEDPYLNGEYAASFVPGFQTVAGGKPGALKASSCCKHFAAYSVENYNGMDRHHYNAVVTEQDLADSYLPAFQTCVTRGEASSLMCSYNAINGVPSCANKALLNDLARDKWGFDGYITSDCGAVEDIMIHHNYTHTREETDQDALDAGTDSNCGNFYRYINTNITNSSIDTALENLFTVQMRLGMYDKSTPFDNLGPADVDTTAHRALALEAAQQGMVLLKNVNGALPFSKSVVKTLLVCGGAWNDSTSMQGNYQGQAPFLVTPFMGLSSYTKVVSDPKEPVDARVCVVRASTMGEGTDRTDNEYLSPSNWFGSTTNWTYCANRGPVVVVVLAGGPIDLTAMNANENVTAIVWAGLPSEQGGQGIADVIFGTVNPSGRLTNTFYDQSFIEQSDFLDMNMRPQGNKPGRTYRFYAGKPVFEFGFGLSYTTFSFKWDAANLNVSANAIANDLIAYEHTPHLARDLAQVSVTVTNTGNVAGSVSTLLFVVPPGAGTNGLPIKSLGGFEKSYLAAGQSVTIPFSVNAFHLSAVDVSARRIVLNGSWNLVVESSSLTVEVA